MTAAALLTLTTACSSGSTDRPAERQNQPASYPDLPDALGRQVPDWSACPTPAASQDSLATEPPGELSDGTAWECATLDAPLDYAEPTADTVELALVRARTPVPAEERLGSLFFNFGGPGGSGVATLPQASDSFEELRLGGYDLVSFDPRGVGESEGVRCLDDQARDEADQLFSGVPDTEEEWRLADEQEAEFVAACVANSGPLLPHVTTANTARDLDLMRHLLGDERLHYFGFSYGTQLGATYAHLFPDRIGRTVLDAVVDPDPDPVHQGLLDARGFQLALDHYLEACVQQADCPVGPDPAAGNRWLAELLADLEDEPLPTQYADGRRLTTALAYIGIASTLYSEGSWEYLTEALTEIRDTGTGTTLLVLADIYEGRNPTTGEYTTQSPSFTAIRCADQPGAGLTEDEVLGWEDEFRAESEVFGPYMVWSLTGCGDRWPVTDPVEPPDYDATGAAEKLLLVATTGDPATPYEGAERMRAALGGPDVAHLLSYDGEGHGAYTSSDPCVVTAVDDWLLTGELPADNTGCPN
ncbi:alpha/beta fold hydrolase [Streptomyces sp. DSM 44915]|uniref:Alpha/beta fold hydrolase n=1 Tax=Streptomyces chisholmiae TaxID=3075540 RepID=A0ABU2JKG6_9ACTN|nr:alpha/beta fold hydrolase [Streptomyces sp. DSM 44915]MDT0265481.1 alpha/beta fold hydrolase [Streptomyces sp. DSM 44915]